MKYSRFSLYAGILFGGILLMSSCVDGENLQSKHSGNARFVADGSEEAKALPIPNEAIALIRPTKGNSARGKVTFTRVPDGIKIVADIDGLSPGKHGFHIHETGDCSAPDASSAGGHFNPEGTHHGSPDSLDRHAGDLGNIMADKKGHGHYERIDAMLRFDGPTSILGKAIIIHADPDDFVSQPAGNAGKRIGCGVINASAAK